MRRVCCLKKHEQCEDLKRVVAAVDKVAHEDVVGAGDLTASVKEFKKVVELAMDITADLQGR